MVILSVFFSIFDHSVVPYSRATTIPFQEWGFHSHPLIGLTCNVNWFSPLSIILFSPQLDLHPSEMILTFPCCIPSSLLTPYPSRFLSFLPSLSLSVPLSGTHNPCFRSHRTFAPLHPQKNPRFEAIYLLAFVLLFQQCVPRRTWWWWLMNYVMNIITVCVLPRNLHYFYIQVARAWLWLGGWLRVSFKMNGVPKLNREGMDREKEWITRLASNIISIVITL